MEASTCTSRPFLPCSVYTFIDVFSGLGQTTSKSRNAMLATAIRSFSLFNSSISTWPSKVSPGGNVKFTSALMVVRLRIDGSPRALRCPRPAGGMTSSSPANCSSEQQVVAHEHAQHEQGLAADKGLLLSPMISATTSAVKPVNFAMVALSKPSSRPLKTTSFNRFSVAAASEITFPVGVRLTGVSTERPFKCILSCTASAKPRGKVRLLKRTETNVPKAGVGRSATGSNHSHRNFKVPLPLPWVIAAPVSTRDAFSNMGKSVDEEPMASVGRRGRMHPK
mmetsp:Transcript_57068/g.165354  ORF Transcript_57068/g.165354 Transcript_57068/m.165354 type:complete len:280 (+) Transcript_57068:395-1234(+)